MYYLTYRPQTIAELDIAHIRETLGAALLANQWSHAYLLIGNRGTGKTSTARLIAKIVNCPKRKIGEEPCNHCPSCQAITSSTSLDVLEIDAASNTGVDDIRDLREKVKLAPVSSPYKVYIIDEVHMLSNSAFNALLKTLEEPPQHVIFVLATTEPQKLPATIVSRCMVFDFGSPKDSEVTRAIERVVAAEKLKVDDLAVAAIVKRAQGSLRDGHKLLEQLLQKSGKGGTITLSDVSSLGGADTALVGQLLSAILSHKREQTFSIIENHLREGKKIKDLYTCLLDEIRTLLLSTNDTELNYDGQTITRMELTHLTEYLLASYQQSFSSPIVQLPLELALDRFFLESPELVPVVPSTPQAASSVNTVEIVTAKWPEVMAAVKAKNHNLLALLRAARPKSLEGNKLTLEVLYSFHRDQLSEEKNRAIFEAVISDILALEIQSKFELVSKS